MKVNKITSQPEFQPVTLQITIESQEELELLRVLFKMNVTVPCQIMGKIEDQKALTELMGDIYSVL